jgi:hypothetical protein
MPHPWDKKVEYVNSKCLDSKITVNEACVFIFHKIPSVYIGLPD